LPAALRARPLDARPDRDEGKIFFLIDVRGYKDDEIAAHPEVCWTVTIQGDNVYLAITGRASVAKDPARARKVWKKSTACGGKTARTIRTAG
jgi:general stress protein 26